MKGVFRFSSIAAGAVLVVAIAMAVVAGCSKKSTNPAPPPGGNNNINSGNIGVGSSYVKTFGATVESVGYHCEIHPGMLGGVKVDPAAASSNVAVSITNTPSFSPQVVSVQPMGTVTWTNNGSMTHTATRN